MKWADQFLVFISPKSLVMMRIQEFILKEFVESLLLHIVVNGDMANMEPNMVKMEIMLMLKIHQLSQRLSNTHCVLHNSLFLFQLCETGTDSGFDLSSTERIGMQWLASWGHSTVCILNLWSFQYLSSSTSLATELQWMYVHLNCVIKFLEWMIRRKYKKMYIETYWNVLLE